MSHVTKSKAILEFPAYKYHHIDKELQVLLPLPSLDSQASMSIQLADIASDLQINQDTFDSNFSFVATESFNLNIFKLVLILLITILTSILFYITFKNTCKSCWRTGKTKKSKHA